jgi:CubicO group peptidase (beta-lactamase class C family)
MARLFFITLAFLLVIDCSILGEGTADKESATQTFVVSNWIVAGPFPNLSEKKEPPDFLESMGGEAAAIFDRNTTIFYHDETGQTQAAACQFVTANSNGMIDLNKHFNLPGKKSAYAFCWLQSSSNQNMRCFLGSGDTVTAWLDGQCVFERKSKFIEQSCIPREYQFSINLHPGKNRLLIKVENTSGDWGFIFEMHTAAGTEEIVAEQARLKLLRDFQNVELRPDSSGGFVFPPGHFPELCWTDPAVVEKLWGKFPLRIKWFDRDLQEVSEALHPGRYAAYVEGDLPNGQMLRRALTLLCVEPECEAWLNAGAIQEEWIPNHLITEKVWRETTRERRQAATAGFGNRLAVERESAVVLSGLSEASNQKTIPAWKRTALMRDVDFHFALKKKLLPANFQTSTLRTPAKELGVPSPALHYGSSAEAGVRDDATERLRIICREWAEEGEEPFTVLVARHGVIVLHEAFGCSNKPPVNLQSRFALDSITKTLTGLMFAQFADQGLMSIDEPIGNHLSEFPITGRTAPTFRHCLTHSTGLDGHGAWGGMRNPWLENVIANGRDYLEPGRRVIYNGMGFDLVGKAMERVTGKNVFELFHENFFDPLGASQIRLSDLGFSAECTAEDLARIGQLILNRGSYGDLDFFSPATFEKMLPRKASEVCPELAVTDWEYGWGLSWERDTDAGKTILSQNTVGHGAFCSTVFRVDLENDLVIAIPRAGPGKENSKYLTRFLHAARDSLQ